VKYTCLFNKSWPIRRKATQLQYRCSAHVRSAKLDDDHTDGAPSNEEDMEEGKRSRADNQGNILDLPCSGVGLVLLLVCGEKRRGVAAGRQGAGDRDVNLFVLSRDERYLGTDST
jgi:hypothetical protein